MRSSSGHTSAPRPKGHRFSETIQSIEDRAAEGPITFGELLEICGPQGHGFLALFLVLPFLQPIPLPGLSSAIGLLLALLGVFVALRRTPWVPRRVAQVKVDPEHLLRICRTAERLLGAIEHVVRPRVAWLFSHRWFRLTNGFVWIVHALVFSLPLPIPFSNSLPAIVILLMALGILEEDFGVIVVAYIGAIANVLFFGGLIAIPTLGWQAFSS